MTAAHCEAKLHGFRKTQDGIVVSFVLHPQDWPQALALDPLGTRYMLAVAQIGDDEQPVTGSSPSPAGDVASPVAPEGDENRGILHCRQCGDLRVEDFEAGRCKIGNPDCRMARVSASPHDAVERPAEPTGVGSVRQGVPLEPPISEPRKRAWTRGAHAGAAAERARAAYDNATPGEKAVTRAVLLCQDERFIGWAKWKPDYGLERGASGFIRLRCGVLSRSELATNPDALARFLALEAQYLADTNQIAEVRG